MVDYYVLACNLLTKHSPVFRDDIKSIIKTIINNVKMDANSNQNYSQHIMEDCSTCEEYLKFTTNNDLNDKLFVASVCIEGTLENQLINTETLIYAVFKLWKNLGTDLVKLYDEDSLSREKQRVVEALEIIESGDYERIDGDEELSLL